MRSHVAFPLPPGFFGAVQLTASERAGYRELAHAHVTCALEAEYAYEHVQFRQLNAQDWRLLKKKQHMCIYRRRKRQSPMVLAIGRVEGTIEDVLYGHYDKTDEEMQLTRTVIEPSRKDGMVLQTLENATPDDPFHYLGIKWKVNPSPHYSFLLQHKDRDVCYLQALGMAVDQHGETYGYHVLRSIDLPQCPPFGTRNVVRSHVEFTFIYRQLNRGVIQVFAQGNVDEASHRVAMAQTMELITGLTRSMQCAEAKKLTILALDSVSFQQKQLEQHKGSIKSPQDLTCSMCTKPKATFTKLRTCRICGLPVCSKCLVKKQIFAATGHERQQTTGVPCCPNCIVKAKSMSIRPAEVDLLTDHSQILKHLLLQHQQQEEFAGVATTIYHGSVGRGLPRDNRPKRNSLHESEFDGWKRSLTETNVTQEEEDYEFKSDDGQSIALGDSRVRLKHLIDDTTSSFSTSKAKIHPSSSSSSWLAEEPTTTTTEEEEVLRRHQRQLFWKIVQLQNAAEQVYEMTQANRALMPSASISL